MKPRCIFIPLSGWLLAAAGATAQTPSAIDVARTELFRQTSAVELRPEGARLVVTVAFSAPPPAGTTVRMRTPRDTVLALERQPDGSFAGGRAFSSVAEREAEFPEGVQAFLVGVGGAETTTNFAVLNTAEVSPVRVFNFDELQALPGSTATVQWTQIPDARRSDSVVLGIARGDGSVAGVVPAPLAGDFNQTQVTGLPLFTALTGTLAYARTTTTTVLNAGATRASVSRGFSVKFPLLCNPSPLVIVAQPRPQAANPGDEVRFYVEVRGLAPLTFQWRRDGVPLPGATDFDLLLRIDVRYPSHGDIWVGSRRRRNHAGRDRRAEGRGGDGNLPRTVKLDGTELRQQKNIFFTSRQELQGGGARPRSGPWRGRSGNFILFPRRAPTGTGRRRRGGFS